MLYHNSYSINKLLKKIKNYEPDIFISICHYFPSICYSEESITEDLIPGEQDIYFNLYGNSYIHNICFEYVLSVQLGKYPGKNVEFDSGTRSNSYLGGYFSRIKIALPYDKIIQYSNKNRRRFLCHFKYIYTGFKRRENAVLTDVTELIELKNLDLSDNYMMDTEKSMAFSKCFNGIFEKDTFYKKINLEGLLK